MPTNEEIIHALEHQQRATDENLTMLAGVIGAQGQDIKRLLQLSEYHSTLLTQHTQILEQHTAILTQHGEILTRIIGRLDGQTTLLAHHDALLKTIVARLPEKPS